MVCLAYQLACVNVLKVADFSISLREGDTLVVRWVDHLGRNLPETLPIRGAGVHWSRKIRIETVINRMTFDGTTTDPMQQAIRDSWLRSWRPCHKLRRR